MKKILDLIEFYLEVSSGSLGLIAGVAPPPVDLVRPPSSETQYPLVGFSVTNPSAPLLLKMCM